MKTLKGIFVFLVLFASVGSQAHAQGADSSLILVEQGTHKVKRETGPVTRVAVGDPTIADVSIINRRELLITGKALGVTSLMVWPAAKGSRAIEYRVKVGLVKDPSRSARPDPELLQSHINPGKSLEGRLPNLLSHRRAKQQAINGKEVQDSSVIALETQVMTEVKVAEISRTDLQAFGFQFSKNSASTLAGIFPSGVLSGIEGGGSAGFSVTSGSGFQPIQNAFQLVGGSAVKSFLGTLSLLERRGMARVLAEPSLVAMSGQTATYLAGGEFPIPVSQGGLSGGGITVQYREFGVRLSISPTILSRDRISLKIAPEVSDLDFSAGIQVGGVAVPALTVRRTDTTVELGDGESFVISGLISSNLRNNVDKVPWLGNIPVIGALFRSTTYSKTDKELVMVVTPRLVRPIARGTALPKLPGAKFDKYDPSFARTMLLESGDFETGFSK